MASPRVPRNLAIEDLFCRGDKRNGAFEGISRRLMGFVTLELKEGISAIVLEVGALLKVAQFLWA